MVFCAVAVAATATNAVAAYRIVIIETPVTELLVASCWLQVGRG